MSSGSQAVTQQLADALRQSAVQAGADSPQVRGADWRMAVVATVASDGTVTTTDGVTARRLAAYQLPAVGDLVLVSQSSSGSWVAINRAVPATGDEWQTPAFASPWANYTAGGGYQTARFRTAGGELIIEGLVTTGATSVSGSSTVFTLPAAYRPATSFAFPQITTSSTVRQLDVLNTGVVRFANIIAGAISYISINCRMSMI